MAAVVVVSDEKPQIRAIDHTVPTLPMLPTTVKRAMNDYERHGTCDLFAALNVAAGTVITAIRFAHTSRDFVSFPNKVNANVPKELYIHVVLDNLATHKTPMLTKWLLHHSSDVIGGIFVGLLLGAIGRMLVPLRPKGRGN